VDKEIGDLVEKEYKEIVFDKDGKYDTVEFISHKKRKNARKRKSNNEKSEKTNKTIDLTIEEEIIDIDNDEIFEMTTTKSSSSSKLKPIILDENKKKNKNGDKNKNKNDNNVNNGDENNKQQKKLEPSIQCNLCKIWLDKSTTLEEHLRSVPHLFSSNSAKETSAVFHLTEQNKGWQIISKDGWDRTGLGPQQKGITEPIQLNVNDGRLGIGLHSKRKRKTLNPQEEKESEERNRTDKTSNEPISKKQRNIQIEQEKAKEKFLHSVIYEDNAVI